MYVYIKRVPAGYIHPVDDKGNYIEFGTVSYKHKIADWQAEKRLWESEFEKRNTSTLQNSHWYQLLKKFFMQGFEKLNPPPKPEESWPENWPEESCTAFLLVHPVLGVPLSPVLQNENDVVAFIAGIKPGCSIEMIRISIIKSKLIFSLCAN